MRIEPFQKEGYELLHHGLRELARIEANGIRIDTNLLRKTKEDLTNRLRDIKKEVEQDKVWKAWRKRFGVGSSITKRFQLGYILYDVLGLEQKKFTAKGKASVDDEVLQEIDHPFVKRVADYYRYDKALGTFVKGIEKEVVGDRLHPVFNLHIARTYRSSSDSPNFQNFPVRNKEIAKIIRSLFIASPGSVLVENDFKGIEVSVSACYHKDENFISYITTPGKDMHRDMAAQIYCLDPKDVSKDARYGAKNKFVFPQFYGDFYVACARNLWEWIGKGNLTNKKEPGTPGEVGLYEHLKSKGIKKLGACDPEEDPIKGTFEYHLKEVENDFWNNRFQQYGRWRRQFYREYLENGYFDILSGFRIHGIHSRNAVTNYPVQGAAFHCLLWSLIQINRRLRKYKMKSLCVGQIHDSLIGDTRINELRDYLEIVEEVTTVELRKHYDWLEVPLEIEYEICPVDKSWFHKKEVKFKDGKFKHPKPDIDKWTSDAEKFLHVLGKID